MSFFFEDLNVEMDSFPNGSPVLNKFIKVTEENPIHEHSKASEVYIAAEFEYPDFIWDGWLPIEYRRTGVSIDRTDKP